MLWAVQEKTVFTAEKSQEHDQTHEWISFLSSPPLPVSQGLTLQVFIAWVVCCSTMAGCVICLSFCTSVYNNKPLAILNSQILFYLFEYCTYVHDTTIIVTSPDVIQKKSIVLVKLSPITALTRAYSQHDADYGIFNQHTCTGAWNIKFPNIAKFGTPK